MNVIKQVAGMPGAQYWLNSGSKSECDVTLKFSFHNTMEFHN